MATKSNATVPGTLRTESVETHVKGTTPKAIDTRPR